LLIARSGDRGRRAGREVNEIGVAWDPGLVAELAAVDVAACGLAQELAEQHAGAESREVADDDWPLVGTLRGH
jgi:hypothetical protein